MVLPKGSSPLLLAGRWLCLSGFPLAFAIVNVGARRYPNKMRSRNMTDGGDKTDSSIALPINFLSNTVEQFLLHAAGMLGLAASVSPKWLLMVPMIATAFFLGRVIFYISYRKFPVMRAYGFSLSIFPSIAMLLYVSLKNLFGIDLLFW
eukprot:gnl/TRDRNA2_/TRDRNA2_213204_c0_seq1.p1 gnl/TRDRNA2_/TRDRNA2_213204_c0~~gnl/TRDRNA2_/TRDRNA2_213204_c0_seq1.p1  ORF type:complete len:149 (-),score=17.40 gnl/TRDRNA2_/TRDRNA2_213204_c0_seq1:172-618(-)